MNGSWIEKFMLSVLCVAERVDEGGGRVREQHHVGLVDRLEAADRRAVEHQAVVEDALVERLGRDVEVLHDAGQVAEPDVDELDVLVLDVLQDLVGVVEHDTSCSPQRALVVHRWGAFASHGSDPVGSGAAASDTVTVGRGGVLGVSRLFRPC